MNDTKVVRPDDAPMTWADKSVAWIYYGPSNYVRGLMSRNVTLDRSVALSKEYAGAKLEALVTHADYKALETDNARIVAEKDAHLLELWDVQALTTDKLDAAHEELARLTTLLAKYQRLHAADVALDESRTQFESNLLDPQEKERRAAMEAIK